MNEKDLAALFQKLGRDDPEGWAHSQVTEGIPQLARFLFLRQAWRAIVTDGDSGWIEAAIARAESHPDEPCAGAGLALARLREKGATDEELTELVRAMQAKVLFSFCYLLEDPGVVQETASDISWALVQLDEKGTVLETIDGLHESVLQTDPTGREMRPRPAG